MQRNLLFYSRRLLLISAVFLFTTLLYGNPLTNRFFYPAEPRATFQKLWIDYDVFENGIKGMRIHAKFTAYDLINTDAYLAIYFKYDDELGAYLKDKNGKFVSTDGYVAVYKSIKPLYNPAVFEDLPVFMPYSEIDLDPGDYDLALDVKLIYQKGGTISNLTTYYFEYTKPDSTVANGGAPAITITATVKDLWVDFDIYENNLKGLRIHVKFNVKKMKDVNGYVAVYFEKKDGTRLTSNNTAYRSSSGQLAVYKLVKPQYDDADFNDLTLFVPYPEFDLPAGRNDLKIDSDLIYKEGGIIQHLKYYEFWMTK